MKQQDIHNLLNSLGASAFELKETHISWVLLGEDYAFKIKKPVQYDFLDFSTLRQRKYYCEREVFLNNRLSEGIYLGVIPVYCQGEERYSLEEKGTIEDYAVKMKRLDNRQQMDQRLEADTVGKAEMDQLAHQLSAFHKRANVIRKPKPIGKQIEDFADILSAKAVLEQIYGLGAGRSLKKSVKMAEVFLRQREELFIERAEAGFVVDGHGDLHARNIFLLHPPVIFDCIEFSDELRQVDILDELAFLSMDLHYHHKEELESIFLETYRSNYEVFRSPSDRQLFDFYKWYRTNVRLKVSLLEMQGQEVVADDLAERVKRLWDIYLEWYSAH